MTTRFGLLAVFLATTLTLAAQIPAEHGPTTAQVPRLVRFSGTLAASATPASSSPEPLAGQNAAASDRVVGVTFALYADETGGAPLWLETQNVQVDPPAIIGAAGLHQGRGPAG